MMTMEADNSTFSLSDVPDLSGVFEESTGPDPFIDGIYEGTVQQERRITDRNGNERVFETTDTPSASGTGRNIRLQIEIKRKSDGRTLGTSYNVFYRPDDLSAETIQKVIAHKDAAKTSGEKVEWGELFGPFMTLQKLATLQKIAGVRSFQRTAEGGLDVSAIYGKKVWATLGPDTRNPQYKEVKRLAAEAPKRQPVL